MAKQEKWSREELIVAFNLYCRLPFGKIHKGNPEVIKLSKLIGRTPSAVGLKLGNFARFDPELKKRNIGGLSHGSKSDEVIWNEFYSDWDKLSYESEILLAKFEGRRIEEKIKSMDEDSLTQTEGKVREAIVKIRVNQYFFRNTVLASYNFKCCITGISIPSLLIASHIKPWKTDIKNRVNPKNGLCLNALHDKAFDSYMITIHPDYSIKVSSRLKKEMNNENIKNFFLKFSESKINLPHHFFPDKEFLEWHNEKFYSQH